MVVGALREQPEGLNASEAAAQAGYFTGDGMALPGATGRRRRGEPRHGVREGGPPPGPIRTVAVVLTPLRVAALLRRGSHLSATQSVRRASTNRSTSADVASTCGDNRSTGPVSSNGARATSATVVTIWCSSINRFRTAWGSDAVGRYQRGDGRRFPDRFDHAPTHDPVQHGPGGRSDTRQPPTDPLRSGGQVLAQRQRIADAGSEIGLVQTETLHRRQGKVPLRGWQPTLQSLGHGRSHGEESDTPGPGHPLPRRGVDDVRTDRAVQVAERLSGVEHQRHTQRRTQRGDLGHRLGHATVAGHPGQVNHCRRVTFEVLRGVGDPHPAVPVDRKGADVEPVGRHHREVGTEFAGYARQDPRPRPAPQQQAQRMLAARR